MEVSGYVPHRVKPKDKIFSATEWVDTYRAPDKSKLPQLLLMENVPQVCGGQNIRDFEEWLKFMENLGYANFYKILNAKDYGVPQNRERCYMVSLLGDYWYDFPKPKKLEKRLKDLLEDNVDEKYFIKDDFVKIREENPTDHRGLQTRQLNGVGYNEMTGRVYSIYGICPTLLTMSGGNHHVKIAVDDERNRRLTELEYWRGMNFDDEDFFKAKDAGASRTSLYNQAGNSIVVAVLEAIFGQLFDKE